MDTTGSAVPFLNDYKILEVLLETADFKTYRAVPRKQQQSVIVKVLHRDHPGLDELVRFRNQFLIARQLKHPHIMRPLTLERCGHGYAMVMPDQGYIPLRLYCQKYGLALSELLTIASQLAKALQYLATQQVIHRDINPDNLYIHPVTQQMVLGGFGIASLLPKETLQPSNPHGLEGTLAYMSPEQTGRVNRGIDYRTDFYSFGVTLFELLTGEHPFQSNDPMELVHCHVAHPVVFPQNGKTMPGMLQQIVLKLMSKNAEDRYQSALGLEHDLEHCLKQWTTMEEIPAFELGGQDICDRFLIPDKLYGREAALQTLLKTFNRVVAQGRVELLLVTGVAGIGKTAIINEVRRPITRQRGYFIKGKFDQLNRNIPFSAFVQAFRSLMVQLLGESTPDLNQWKHHILAAVGENGQVLIEVIPELKQILGAQPAVPDLSGAAAQNRFNFLFGQFIQVFITQHHPLVIFLDDLQWADAASLGLLQLLMNSSGQLLVLGAYRDNEVLPTHDLMLTLDAFKDQGQHLHTLTLATLSQISVQQLVADTLRCKPQDASPLANLIYQKTQGNPFFTRQFLQRLYTDGHINFDVKTGSWQCDMHQIRQLTLTDDVVTFMLGQLQLLPVATQEVIKLAACMGNRFDLATLAIVCEKNQGDIATDLWPSLQAGLLLPEDEVYRVFQGSVPQLSETEHISLTYRFLHDRVQQAAYALIPQGQKKQTHYRLGQLLSEAIAKDSQSISIFELINHLNYGAECITSQSFRDHVASLNLKACHKARNSNAYQAGRDYAAMGLSLLGDAGWQRQYDVSLRLYGFAVEFAWLCGDLSAMAALSQTVLQNAQSLLDQVPIFCFKIQADTSQMRFAEAIKTAQQVLESLDVLLPQTAAVDATLAVVSDLEQLCANKSIMGLASLPDMTDPKDIATINIISHIIPAAYIAGSLLFPWLVALAVRLSIQSGNLPISAFIYINYSYILCNHFQAVETSEQFGQLALQLANQPHAKAVRPQVYVMLGLYTLHRKTLIQKTISLVQQGYGFANDVGNQEWAGYSAYAFCANGFASAQNLAKLEKDIQGYCDSLINLHQVAAVNWCQIYHQTVLTLSQPLQQERVFFGTAVEESKFVDSLITAQDLLGLYHFHLCKLIENYLFSDLAAAQHHSFEVRSRLAVAQGTVGVPLFYFYDSLMLLGQLDRSSDDLQQKTQVILQVEENQHQLRQYWAEYAPMNYQHKLDLVEAEKLRWSDQRWQALEFYDQAIAGAQIHGYIQEEALANERAARMFLDWGKQKVAAGYMQEAYYCYARWGAEAKTDDLAHRYPQLLHSILQQSRPVVSSFDTLASVAAPNLSDYSSNRSVLSYGRTNTALDFATVLKSAQALSESIHIDPLLKKLAAMMLQNSGADKLVLLLPSIDNIWQVRSIATPTKTQLFSESVDGHQQLPQKLIQYVQNTQEVLVIDELVIDSPILDDYLLKYQPQSVLGMPILHQGKLRGILYLEHQSTAGVFSHERLLVLNFLCTQAAISLENAQLFSERLQAEASLKESQEQLQALVTGTAATTGKDFFPALVRHIATALEVSNVIVTKRHGPQLQTLAFWDKGKLQSNVTFDFQETPCENVIQDHGCYYCEHSVQAKFPAAWLLQQLQVENYLGVPLLSNQGKIIGDLFILGQRPIQNAERAKQILQVFAARAAAEVERQWAYAELEQLNQSLEVQVQERTTALRENEGRLRLAMKAANQGFFDVNLQTDTVIVSSEYALMLGYEPTSFHETPEAWRARLHPEDKEQTYQAYRNYKAGHVSRYEAEFRQRTLQGGWKWILSMGKFIEWDALGQPTRFLGTHIDISDRKFAEIQLKAQNELLAKIAQGDALVDVLNTLIHTVEHTLDGVLCSVLLLDDGHQLRHGAAPSLPAAYNQAVDGIPIGENVGSCGTAAFRNEIVIVADIANDPLWCPYKHLALSHDLRACWSNPIKASDDKVLGTFAMYYRKVKSPQTNELNVISQMAHIAGIAIERQQAEKKLRQSETTLLEAQQIAHIGNWEFDIPNQTITWSPEMFRMYGLKPRAKGPSYAEFLQMLLVDDRTRLQQYVERAIKDGIPYNIEYSILRADGSISHHECRAEVDIDAQGQVKRLFGTALDITERKQAKLALQSLITGTAATTGKDFFPILVRYIAEALNVTYAVISEHIDDTAHMLAFWANGRLVSGHIYDLAHTPCEKVLEDDEFYCEYALKQAFPNAAVLSSIDADSYLGIALKNMEGQVIGNLSILHTNPLPDPHWAAQILHVFAARASAELERQRAELAIKRQLAAIEATVDGIGILKDDTYIYVNQAHLQLFGYDHADELVGKNWRLLYPPDEVQRLEQDVFPLLDEKHAWWGEAIGSRKDGSTFAQGLSLTLTEDGLVISVCRNISELKQAQALITHNALHDPLTDLPNRTLLLERLDLAIHRLNRQENYRYAVLFLDLDRFKVINDSLGHIVGDQLLVATAQRLKSHLRKTDLVARLGGDEFLILLEDVRNTEEIVQIAQRILADCQTPLFIEGNKIFTSISIGIVLGTKKYHQANDLIRDADIAMYQAKAQESNSYKFFNTTMHTQVLKRLTLETDLRKALDQQEFTIHYQPIIDLSRHHLVGFEALVRWHHPTLGLIAPDEFIPIAEESGLIAAIDSWVFNQACQQMVEWNKTFANISPLKININLSVQDLSKANLIQDIDTILASTGLDGSLVTLEITESTLIEDIDQTVEILTQLNSRHMQISIDDFGTGYSSLQYLHRLPVHHLKIDRSFVGQMQTDNRNYQVVNTIIALSKQLGLTAVAEGIETNYQLQQLRQLNCPLGQGYLFASPLTVQQVEAQLSRAKRRTESEMTLFLPD